MMLEKPMRKRFFGRASAVLLALSFPVEAQQPKKIWRMGYLSSVNPVNESARAEGKQLGVNIPQKVLTRADRVIR